MLDGGFLGRIVEKHVATTGFGDEWGFFRTLCLASSFSSCRIAVLEKRLSRRAGAPLEVIRWKSRLEDTSGTVLTTYVNGSPIGTGTLNDSIPDPSTDFLIGTAEFDRPSRLFSGCIDEVRIYDRELTGSEIEYLYNAQ